MRVTYLGHACFLLADDNFSLTIDPFSGIGFDLKDVKSDFCLCSHGHFDHCAVHAIDVSEVIDEEKFCEYPWLRVISSYHDDDKGMKRGENKIFIIDLSGIKICHMGDIGENFNVELCEKIESVDVLLIPVGGNYTIDAKTAFKYVQKINPKLVVPMHYKTKRNNVEIESKDEFLSYFDNVVKMPTSFEVDLPQELTVYDLNDDNF